MDTIRDMLSVGQGRNGDWLIYFWGGGEPSVLGHFPREDEAWGVTSMILEYVEIYGHDPQAAIWAALDEYHQALGDERALDNEPDADELGRIAHAHIMEAYPN